MIRCTIKEHLDKADGFIVDVEEVIHSKKHPRFIVSREFTLNDRNDNFARAIEFARVETAQAITANISGQRSEAAPGRG